MKSAAFTAYTQELSATLQRNPAVLGLILLGSTAGTHHQPDHHSDHDFFVIVSEEKAEVYHNSVDWLPPRAAQIVHHFRDTQHGARVIYADGHLLEYAVFTPEEIALIRNHHARIAFDKLGDLESRLAPTLKTPEPKLSGIFSDLYLHLLVGVGRHARGEGLAGRQQLHFAVQDTLALLHALIPAQNPELVDDRNPWRRVEKTHPAAAQAIVRPLEQPTPQAAQQLLGLVREWAGNHPSWDEQAAQAVEQRIQAAL